ncbi:hypothetical protein FQA39_LY08024 [Lamprigera yunnana]|nr:hypothetical protein FQA39_LY08024 [Lamprigera yunnana]
MNVYMVILIVGFLHNAAACGYIEFLEAVNNDDSYIKAIKVTCVANANADPELVDAIFSEGMFPDDDTLKDYMLCILLNLKIVSLKEFLEAVNNDDSYIKAIKVTCVANANADPELVDAIFSEGMFPDDDTLKDYMLCILLNLKIFEP